MVMPNVHSCMSIVIQMVDNARILMAKYPFLRLCLQIVFCGTNFNPAQFDRNGVVISRSYHIDTHLGLFIRVIRRLSCEMTAYDLGRDTTVRLENLLGLSNIQRDCPKSRTRPGTRRKGFHSGSQLACLIADACVQSSGV